MNNYDNQEYVVGDLFISNSSYSSCKKIPIEVETVVTAFLDKVLAAGDLDCKPELGKNFIEELSVLLDVVSFTMGKLINSKPYLEKVRILNALLQARTTFVIMIFDVKPMDKIDICELNRLTQKYVEVTI